MENSPTNATDPSGLIGTDRHFDFAHRLGDFSTNRDKPKEGTTPPRWSSGGVWRFEDTKIRNLTLHGQMVSDVTDDPFLNYAFASSWFEYDVSSKLTLKGTVDCGNGCEVPVDIAISTTISVRQQYSYRIENIAQLGLPVWIKLLRGVAPIIRNGLSAIDKVEMLDNFNAKFNDLSPIAICSAADKLRRDRKTLKVFGRGSLNIDYLIGRDPFPSRNTFSRSYRYPGEIELGTI